MIMLKEERPPCIREKQDKEENMCWPAFFLSPPSDNTGFSHNLTLAFSDVPSAILELLCQKTFLVSKKVLLWKQVSKAAIQSQLHLHLDGTENWPLLARISASSFWYPTAYLEAETFLGILWYPACLPSTGLAMVMHPCLLI